MLESADSELESADSSTDSNTDPAKAGVWVWAFSQYDGPGQYCCPHTASSVFLITPDYIYNIA